MNLSICVPNHKNPELLSVFLAQIQKLKALVDFELIVVDSGACEKSFELLVSDKSVDKYLSEPDKGIYDAFNKAVSLATKEWILFMGVDDKIISKDNLLQHVNFISTASKNIVSFPVFLNLKKSQIISKPFNFVNKGVPHMTCSHQGIYHRRSYIKINKFDTKMEIASDYKMFLNAVVNKDIVSSDIPPAVLMNYSGISSQNSNQLKLYFECMESYKKVVGFSPNILFKFNFFFRSLLKVIYAKTFSK